MSNQPFYTRSKLTPRRIEVLKTIYRMTSKSGQSPSLQELSIELGMPDRQSAHNHLLVLRHQGMVEWKKSHARTMTITNDGLKVIGKNRAVHQG